MEANNNLELKKVPSKIAKNPFLVNYLYLRFLAASDFFLRLTLGFS